MNIKQIIQKWRILSLKYTKYNYTNIRQKFQELCSISLKYIKDNYTNIRQNLLNIKDKILEAETFNKDSNIETKNNVDNDDFDKTLEHIKEQKKRNKEHEN